MKHAVIYAKDNGRIVGHLIKVDLKHAIASLDEGFDLLEFDGHCLPEEDTHKVDLETMALVEEYTGTRSR